MKALKYPKPIILYTAVRLKSIRGYRIACGYHPRFYFGPRVFSKYFDKLKIFIETQECIAFTIVLQLFNQLHLANELATARLQYMSGSLYGYIRGTSNGVRQTFHIYIYIYALKA